MSPKLEKLLTIWNLPLYFIGVLKTSLNSKVGVPRGQKLALV